MTKGYSDEPADAKWEQVKKDWKQLKNLPPGDKWELLKKDPRAVFVNVFSFRPSPIRMYVFDKKKTDHNSHGFPQIHILNSTEIAMIERCGFKWKPGCGISLKPDGFPTWAQQFMIQTCRVSAFQRMNIYEVLAHLEVHAAGGGDRVNWSAPMSRKEIGQIFLKHPNTISKWIREGTIKTIKVGNSFKVDLNDFPAEKKPVTIGHNP